MKHQLQQIREALETVTDTADWGTCEKALTAVSELEAMVGEQEPILIVKKGEICYKSQADDQSYGMWCPVTPDTEHGLRNGTQLYAAPPAQQPQEEHLTITWDEQQTRILAVSMQDEEGRILKVLAEAPAQQPKAEAVKWGVDWGTHGDRTCVSIIKKHSDGTIEVVANEYEPEANVARKAPQQPQAECRNCGGEGKFQMYGPAWDCRACNGTGKQPQAVPPANCRQRLKHDGKAYPRSSCAACGEFSPKWKECDAAMAQGEKP